MLELQNLKLSNGKHVAMDATLIQSSRRAKKVLKTNSDVYNNDSYEVDKNNPVEYSNDRGAKWTYKAGKYTYGYSSVVTTDANGLINKATTHPANTSESSKFVSNIKEVKNHKGTKILYDKEVSSKQNQKVLKEQGLQNGIMRKKPKGDNMTYWNKLRNKTISKRRFIIERTFRTLKRTYGMSRTRYISIEKVVAEVNLKAIAYNLTRVVNFYKAQTLSAG